MAKKKTSPKSKSSEKKSSTKPKTKPKAKPKSTKKATSTKPKSKPKTKAKPKTEPPTIKDLSRKITKFERENDKLKEELKSLKDKSKDQGKRLGSVEGKVETRVKREEVIMKALRISSRTQKGEVGVIGDLNRSILKAEEYLLHTGKRIDKILSAIKNHREYLIRLNKKVHKLDARKRIEMEVDIMNNTISIMALSGYDINKSLFTDVMKIRKMMEKKDVELSKIKKKMERLGKKFEDEMERFDYESIFKKSDDIPGYR